MTPLPSAASLLSMRCSPYKLRSCACVCGRGYSSEWLFSDAAVTHKLKGECRTCRCRITTAAGTSRGLDVSGGGHQSIPVHLGPTLVFEKRCLIYLSRHTSHKKSLRIALVPPGRPRTCRMLVSQDGDVSRLSTDQTERSQLVEHHVFAIKMHKCPYYTYITLYKL